MDDEIIFSVLIRPTHFNHDGLCGSLLSDQQHSLLLLHDGLHQEVRPHVVHVRDQDGRVVWDVVFGVDVLWNLQCNMKTTEATDHVDFVFGRSINTLTHTSELYLKFCKRILCENIQNINKQSQQEVKKLQMIS